jgi:biopolymer transport protein ExbD
MANVDTDTGKKRGINADINMIPFIDLLMVTVAFLLITAVWVTNSRISTNAEIAGPADGTVVLQPVEKVLHVTVRPDSFLLTWRQGAVVVSEVTVERGPGYDVTALKAKIAEEWVLHGSHKDPHDPKLDQVVLHTDDRLPFREITSVLDAVEGTRRPMILASREEAVGAFNTTFSVR